MSNVRTMTVDELRDVVLSAPTPQAHDCLAELARRAALLDRLEAVVRERRVLLYEVSHRDGKDIGCEMQRGGTYEATTLRAAVEAALEANP